MRHIASNEVIHFGTASVLTDTLIVRNGSPTKDYLDNLDAVLIDIPINSTYLSLALFTQACSFEEVMGVVVHGFGCKFSSAKFFSGRVCSKIEEDTFCASSHGTPKGLSGSACTVGNICIGIIQSRTKTGLNHTVHDPSSQTLGSPAAFTTDRFVTALFGDSKLTYIMSSSVLLRIRAGILGGTGAPAITTLAVATAAVQDTEESIATSDDEEGEEDEAFRLVPVRHTKRRCGGGSRTAIAAAPVEPGLNIHKQNHYQCCSIS